MTEPGERGFYIVLISVHGLIRGHNLELGRDADTGGQTKYVVELARAMAENPEVDRVDVLTRQVIDPKVDADYAEPQEQIAPGAYIVRLPCGPRRYLRKEVLWPHLDALADNALAHVRRVGRNPDVIHSHYADAGYVAAHMAAMLGVPMVHTGHSLGRVKYQRLVDNGVKASVIESQYNISQRIEAEEIALDAASLVIASTRQEVEEQYVLYDDYHPRRMIVIPPGVDLSRFHPPKPREAPAAMEADVYRFLRNPRRPMIFAMSRPDERKNLATLVRAYGENHDLRKLANLVIVAGNRDDITTMEKGPREVLSSLLFMIDRYDLYGSVAYPKHHDANDVPDLYRIAARHRGVFVNPALTEPFGLTLIEAAACGLPIIATEDGGPRDIVAFCKNGVLIDPLDPDGIGEVILEALTDRRQWTRWSKSGLKGVHQHYSWQGHVRKYLQAVRKIIGPRGKKRVEAPAKSRLPTVDRILVCDVDNTLVGDAGALQELMQKIQDAGAHIGFGVATGRRIESTRDVLQRWKIPMPDLLITSVGTEVYYGHRMVQDTGYQRHISHRWQPQDLRKVMRAIPGLKLQPKEEQRQFKISYFVDPEEMPHVREIVRHLRKRDLHANVIYSHHAFLDLIPVRASKGRALRYLAAKWDIAPECVLVAGDSGNDEEMLLGNTLGVVVGNYSAELERLRGKPRIYFAEARHARGVIEGMEYYDFLGSIRIPEEEGV